MGRAKKDSNLNNFYITTPIYYVNDRPHIGHAYTSVACDVLARFNRLCGKNVKFLTGTDEHGQKVEKSAENAGIPPQDFVDNVSQYFRELAKLMNISNDDFIRTTEPRHKQAAQALWKKMQDNGHIYLGAYSGWYSVRDEAYYQESELVSGKAPTGADVEWVEEPSYFFNLSKWQDKLLKYYEENPDFIAPESRRNEIISFVKGGLKDLSISRTSFSWGIPVPDDEKHIMYVWLDALTNYLSALGYPDEKSPDYQNFWRNSYSMHMVGKDIIRFHAVYWPAFLMAADLPLPKRIFAHGWWTVEGEKMSKSLGNVVVPSALVEEFGLDQTRWFLMREVPFGNDGNFSRERMIIVINSELANNIGNLVQRTLSMVAKNCDGKVPDAGGVEKDELDMSFLYKIYVTESNTPQDIENRYMNCRFNDIMADIIAISSEANNYIDTKAPWKQKKTDVRLMNATLYHLLEAIRCIAIMIQPFIPHSSGKILDLLCIPMENRSFSCLSTNFSIQSGTPLPPPEPVFPRFVEKGA
ncbi:MAG: methionine--tRNA ligase [Pseudomonadota bacterium]